MELQNSSIYNLYLLDGQGGSSPLSMEDFSKQDRMKDTVWIDLDYTDTSAQTWLKSQAGLNTVVYEALIANDSRPRLVHMDDGLLVILRGINLNPGAEPDEMISIRLWITEKMILSTRMNKLYSIEDVKNLLSANKGPKTSGDFLVELVQRLVSRMVDPIDNLEDIITNLETQVILSEDSDLRSDLSALRRQTVELRRFLTPQRDVLAELQNEKFKWFKKHDRLVLHETKERLIRHIEDLDAIRDRAIITSEELLNHISNRMNNRMYILSLVAAIFIPLGFLTGLLGVNIGGIPGAEYPYAFGIFIIIMLIIVFFQILIFKRKKWF